MKWMWLCALSAAVAVSLAPSTVDAKRLGGGKSAGMQRSAPAQPPANTATPTPAPAPAPTATPNPSTAAAPATAGAAAAAAPKRSWMGPIAGIAAGLGLAALFSHLGMGAGFANVLTLLLLGVLAFFVIRFLMRRFMGGAAQGPAGRGGLAYAAAGASGAPMSTSASASRPGSATYGSTATAPSSLQRQAVELGGNALPDSAAAKWGLAGSHVSNVAPAFNPSQPTAGRNPVVPPEFDLKTFERVAKMIFIRMQAANDAGDLDDLRNFTTPELFAALKLDLLERGSAKQQTDVVSVEAQVIDYVQEHDRQIVSVNYQGQVREQPGAEPEHFDEIWHLTKPVDGSESWAIAGVQQRQ